MHIEEIEIKDGGIHKHLLFESGRWDDFLTAAKSPPKGWKYRKGSRKVSEKFSLCSKISWWRPGMYGHA